MTDFSIGPTIFRPLTLDDADSYLAMMTDQKIIHFSGTIPLNPTLDWAVERLQSRNTGKLPYGPQEFGLFIANESQEVLIANALWFLNEDDQPEIGYAVHSAYRGRGVAQDALRFIINHTWQLFKNTSAILASVAKENAASIHILEKSGFLRTGERRAENKVRNAITQLWVYSLPNPRK